MTWSGEFDDPISLPGRGPLRTLRRPARRARRREPQKLLQVVMSPSAASLR